MALARTELRNRQATKTFTGAVDGNGVTLNLTRGGNGVTPARRLIIQNLTDYLLATEPAALTRLGIAFDDANALLALSPRDPPLVLEGEFYEIDVMSSSLTVLADYGIVCVY